MQDFSFKFEGEFNFLVFFKGISLLKLKLISSFNARYPTDSLRGPLQTLRRGAERRVKHIYILFKCMLKICPTIFS